VLLIDLHFCLAKFALDEIAAPSVAEDVGVGNDESSLKNLSEFEWIKISWLYFYFIRICFFSCFHIKQILYKSSKLCGSTSKRSPYSTKISSVAR
jgi:hypothetical protein